MDISSLPQSFNSQILFRSFLAVIFFLLAIAPIAGLWIMRREKNYWFKFFLAVLFIILFAASFIFGVSARKYYLNKNTVDGGALVLETSGILEKYEVKTGRFGEIRRYEYKINGEKYTVWPDDLLSGFASGEEIVVYYIKLLDTDSFKVNKHKSVIINFER